MRIQVTVLAGLAWLVPLSVRAQGFDAENFRAANSTSAAFSQEMARVLGRGDFDVGLTLDYAHNPLVLRDPVTNDVVTNGGVVSDRLVGHLGAAFGFGDVLEARVGFPVVIVQNGNVSDLRSGSLGTTTLGDLRVGGKAALYGKRGEDGFKLALAADLDVPTGSANNFAGDDMFSFRPRVIAGVDMRNFSGALTAGYAFRKERTVAAGNLTVDDQLLAGLALGYAIKPTRLWALGEAFLSHVNGSSGGVRNTPLEAIVGARYAVSGPWMVQGGIGTGLTNGVGAPAVRVILAVGYATDLRPPPPPPPAPPPPPPPPPPVKQPPPDVDTDGDGIVDRLDKVPTEPEDKDGFEDDDGCPDPDNDKDGVPDVTDKCPMDPEDKDGFEDEDGCPDPDNDKDGFLDGVDKCPNEPETFNGFEDDDGCPDKGPVLVVLTDQQIEIKQQVNFATDKSTIKKNSFVLLATVARIMKLHPEITKVRVEGHTDNHGTEQHNLKLSQDRADSVRKHLIEVDGIDAARLEAVGYGLGHPIADNKSAKGRALNRRSAFVILERAPAPGPAAPAGAATPATPAPPATAAPPVPPAPPPPVKP